jgi:hypothetical protein
MLVNGIMMKETEKECLLMLTEMSKFNFFIFLYIYLFFRYVGHWDKDEKFKGKQIYANGDK